MNKLLSRCIGALTAVCLLPLSHPATATCVRFAQLVADAPNVPTTVTLADTTETHTFSFADPVFPSITDYQLITPGGYQVIIQAQGFPPASSPGRFNRDTDYTALAIGEVFAAGGQTLDDILLIDDNQLAPPGMAKLRVLHMAPDTGFVDVLVNDTPHYTRVGYKNVTEYRQLQAGANRVVFQDTDTVVATLDDLVLDSGSVVSVILVGLAQRLGNVTAVATVDAPNTCNQRRFSGIWFDPEQTGQGVQIVQNGDAFGGVWYVYGEDGQSAWYNFIGTLQNERFVGDLIAFTGPLLSEPFDAEQVENGIAGSVSITFSPTERSALFEATIAGRQRVLNLLSFSL